MWIMKRNLLCFFNQLFIPAPIAERRMNYKCQILFAFQARIADKEIRQHRQHLPHAAHRKLELNYLVGFTVPECRMCGMFVGHVNPFRIPYCLLRSATCDPGPSKCSLKPHQEI